MESYDSLYLVETADKIFIHPAVFNSGDRFVVINRITDEISIAADGSLIPDTERLRTISISGILGVTRLIAGPYLVVIKNRIRIGEIGTHAVWQLNQYEVIPFKKTLLHLSEKQMQYNTTYLEMLNTTLTTPNFYYSHTYDLSHNMQSLDLTPPDFLKQTIVERAETRFVWNAHMLELFHGGRPEFHKFCVPIIHGFVSITQVALNSKQFKFILVSRRSAKRPGTRLFSRGIDSNGNVSNFVETEQIVEHGSEMTSFVQIRGSIPLYWTQKPNLKYKPNPQLGQLNHAEAYTKHFEDLILRYSRVVSVNLVNQTGSEGNLEQAFKSQAETTPIGNTRYEAFDFHHECRKMNWERLSILINRLSNEVEEFKYFMRAGSGQRQHQDGVFRTNCIDCLDRTNVVQGMLARVNLEQVLKKINVFREGEKLADHHDFEYLIKNVWADNGDIVSIEYSGTGALKTDFTRTGKRTFMGVLRDGYNSLVRYLKNNFNDGYRQDALDLFIGNYSASEKEGVELVCPLEKNRDLKYYALPAFLTFSFVMFISLVLLPSEYTPEYLFYILFWGTMTFATGGVILHYGKEFVDNPMLTEPPRLT